MGARTHRIAAVSISIKATAFAQIEPTTLLGSCPPRKHANPEPTT